MPPAPQAAAGRIQFIRVAEHDEQGGNYIARCTLPLFTCLIAGIAIVTVFPITVTWLPDYLTGSSK